MRKYRFLVVDDEQSVRLFCKNVLLRGFGQDADIDEAGGCEEARGLLSTEPPYDVVITDNDMPDGTSSDVIRHVDGRSPVLVVSGRGRPAELSEDATFLQKPFGVQEFLAVVKELLEERI